MTEKWNTSPAGLAAIMPVILVDPPNIWLLRKINFALDFEKTFLYTCRCRSGDNTGALSSAGRAPALQAGGHRFEPYSAHQGFSTRHWEKIQLSESGICGPVVQLVRTLACHARGRGFESLPGRQFFSSSFIAHPCTDDKAFFVICIICPDSSVGRAED